MTPKGVLPLSHTHWTPQTPVHILVIDDSPEDRVWYKRLLRSGPEPEYVFHEATLADEGLALLETEPIDCVLLDYQLPGQDGLDVLQQFEAKVPDRSFAVVMLTGQGDETVAVTAMKSGAADYLSKSRLSPEALQRAVLHAIEKVHLQRQLAEKQAELERLVMTDPLTGLSNRRCFMERLGQETSRSQRYHSPLSLLVLDLDRFKWINDTLGHLTGDSVLKEVGELLLSCQRESDITARYGGEEFCLLAPNTSLEGAIVLGERVRRTIDQHTFTTREGKPFRVTCSIGVAEVSCCAYDATELIAQADDAMYQAKQSGRNRVCVANQNLIAVC